MAFQLRLVQKFDPSKREEFLEIEKEFAAFEAEHGLPRGRRLAPFAGKEPTNTLVWEHEFETMDELTRCYSAVYAHPVHEALLARQSPLMRDCFVEIYETL